MTPVKHVPVPAAAIRRTPGQTQAQALAAHEARIALSANQKVAPDRPAPTTVAEQQVIAVIALNASIQALTIAVNALHVTLSEPAVVPAQPSAEPAAPVADPAA